MKKLFLFTKNDCTPCKMVKQYLKSEDVEAQEIDIFDNQDVVDGLGIMSVPTLIYIDAPVSHDAVVSYEALDASSTVKVTGFDMPKLEEVVKEYKK